jgi:hypothetical protein
MAAALHFYIVESFDSQKFSQQLEQRLAEGWLLHGPMTAFPNDTQEGKVIQVRYVQALIKDATPVRKTGFSTSIPQV